MSPLHTGLTHDMVWYNDAVLMLSDTIHLPCPDHLDIPHLVAVI